MANPFLDDVVDYTGAVAVGQPRSYTNASSEDDAAFYEREIERYLQESVDSTTRSRQHLEQSEQLGIRTAQDLAEQREKLENASRGLDQIQATSKQTQRNINSLKSVFKGYFQNKFAKSSKISGVPEVTVKEESQLTRTVEKLNNPSSYTSPFSNGETTLKDSSRAVLKQNNRWQAMDNQVEENLDAIGNQLGRLKVLGTALGQEVKEQNELLDHMDPKVRRTNDIINKQNAELNRL